MATCSLLVLMAVAAAASAAEDDLVLVSGATSGAGADGHSRSPSVSADGRYVAFDSEADNLSDDDDDSVRNIFVRDVVANSTTLVSRGGATDAGADGQSFSPSISADGRFVAFHSLAANLSEEDEDTVGAGFHGDVFVRDLDSNTTTLVSRATGIDGAGGDTGSGGPSISADGRYVAFHSQADNLSDDDNNVFFNIFVRDLVANTTTLVSRQSGAAGVGAVGTSSSPSISADGRHVAFDSQADDLSTEDSTSLDVFVRDLVANTTTLVSRASGDTGAGADDVSYDPVISADGRHVAFHSTADNLSDEDNDAFFNVFVRDLSAKTTVLVNKGGVAGAGSEGSFDPSISADGRYVAFDSDADDLSYEDNDAFFNVFVRDLVADSTTLASRAGAVTAANGDSFGPSISAYGRYIAFTSDADNLSSDDNDAFDNIYLRDVFASPAAPPAPSAPPAVVTGGDGKVVELQDGTAPRLTVRTRTRQRLRGKQSRISLTASCDEACTLAIRTRVVTAGKAKTFRLRASSQALAPGKRTTVRVRLTPKALASVRRTLRRGGRATVTLDLKATDRAGNSTSRKLRVALRR